MAMRLHERERHMNTINIVTKIFISEQKSRAGIIWAARSLRLKQTVIVTQVEADSCNETG